MTHFPEERKIFLGDRGKQRVGKARGVITCHRQAKVKRE
jgi:hypothetical protein